MHHRRTRRVRPSSHITLVLIVYVLSILVWVCWEVGRVLVRIKWWRILTALASGATLVLFAIGDYLQ